jgi:hypothetical protein
VVAGLHDAAQDVSQLRLVIKQAQERFTLCALLADPQDVFRRWIQANNQQTTVEKNDARAQAVKDAKCFFAEYSAAARMARRFALAYRRRVRTEFCCT